MEAPIEVSRYDSDTAVVVLRGEHDLSSRPELEGTLQALVRSGSRVVVDISQAEFIDSMEAPEGAVGCSPRGCQAVALVLIGAVVSWPAARAVPRTAVPVDGVLARDRVSQTSGHRSPKENDADALGDGSKQHG